MKRFALFLVLLATPAAAQSPQIGYFFDQAGTQTTEYVSAFTVSDFYLLAAYVPEISAWEAGGAMSDPSWTIFSVVTYPPCLICLNDWNFIVGLGSCVQPAGNFLTLARYEYGYFVGGTAPNDVSICVGPASPSSFPGTPGYADCDDQLIPFTPFVHASDLFADGCAVINCTVSCPVSVAAESFGGLKARF